MLMQKTTQFCFSFRSPANANAALNCTTQWEESERERQAAANNVSCAATSLSPLPLPVDVLAAFILAAIEHFNHLVLALSGSKLCFLIIVVSSSFINCCISVQYTHHTHTPTNTRFHIITYQHSHTQSHTLYMYVYASCISVTFCACILKLICNNNKNNKPNSKFSSTNCEPKKREEGYFCNVYLRLSLSHCN